MSSASSCDITGSTVHHVSSIHLEPGSNQACKSYWVYKKYIKWHHEKANQPNAEHGTFHKTNNLSTNNTF